MVPFVSARNRTPSSTEPGSLVAIWPGVADAFQMLHGHVGPVPVVNDQTELLTSALPARSFAPPLPPVIVTV
jgi:hypothetical protein